VIEYGRRRKRLPAPPEVVRDDLVERRSAGTRAWLMLINNEVLPRVLESSRPTRVVWSSSWPDRPKDLVVLELEKPGERLLSRSPSSQTEMPDDSATGHFRKRISHLLFVDLRFSYGQ
jgi:hypothetical protein